MNKMSIRKRFAVTVRGFGILKKYCPGLVQGKALYESINSLQPFVTVWISARIINELSAQQRIKNIVGYVVGIVLINFVCAVLKNSINRRHMPFIKCFLLTPQLITQSFIIFITCKF